MIQSNEILGYNSIIDQIESFAITPQGKRMARKLTPFLSEIILRKNIENTTQARDMYLLGGTPPLPLMERMEEYLIRARTGELLIPSEIEEIGVFLTAVRRMIKYLERGKEAQLGICFYADNLCDDEELASEIARSVRGGRIDDYASRALVDIRRDITVMEEKMKTKAENCLRTYKSYLAENFVVSRNGRICIPIKKEYRAKVPGTVIDHSSTGSTVFLEPEGISILREQLELRKIDEDTEERRILYCLVGMICEREAALSENIRVIGILDFVFAKAKLSLELQCVEPSINTERRLVIKKGRNPQLQKETCVPLDFTIEDGKHGVIITGPNTGGKTVAIKTVGLLSLMACSGLHVPCESADIAMNNSVLCDIGDGQSIESNLSTFSSHIKNIIEILQVVSNESLVILDELGSGTDPAEGMGIAISVLEQLRKSGCTFLVTTHYPEVREYAVKQAEIETAGMAFDRENLKPLYRLEIGKSGRSCALYIAKHLGIPNEMLLIAAQAAYKDKSGALVEELSLTQDDGGLKKKSSLKIEKQITQKRDAAEGILFTRGDSVTVLPDEVIGIVVQPADRQGNVLVQVKKEKILVNHKRLKLKVAASELYPEDYDFSIIFDTVETRKARHIMGKRHVEGLSIEE